VCKGGIEGPRYVGFDEVKDEASVRALLATLARDLHRSGSASLLKILGVFGERFLDALTSVDAGEGARECVKYLKSLGRDLSVATVAGGGKRFKGMTLKFYHNAELDLHLIMVNGRLDGVLVELGRTMGLPRGCVMLWRRGGYVDFRGFYPKFENDERGEGEFDYSVLEGAESLTFFKKWSGYLLHVIAFEASGTYYWTVCSKKSADQDSPYLRSGRAIVESRMTPALARELADGRLYLGGEAMDTTDVHGYVARRNALIVTCVGEGTFANLRDGRRSVEHGGGTLVRYLDPSAVAEFAVRFDLECDSSIAVEGRAGGGGGTVLEDFVQCMLRERDLLTNDAFDTRLAAFGAAHPAAVRIGRGTASHAELVGDVLEGFVFILGYGGGREGRTVKVKLPHYTWRTMFLRQIIQDKSARGGFGWVSDEARRRIDRFAERWCCTAAGRERFRRYMKCAMALLAEAPLSAAAEVDPVAVARLHVDVADAVTSMLTADPARFAALVAAFDRVVPDPAAADQLRGSGGGDGGDAITVCVVLGPVGSGKSTIMRRMVEADPARLEAVDGDLVAGEWTMRLGAERGVVTLSRVYEAVLRGRVPVVSCGGGVFTREDGGGQRACALKESLRRVFGRDVRLVAVLMSGGGAGVPAVRVPYRELEAGGFFVAEYSRLDEPAIAKMVRGRAERGDAMWLESKDGGGPPSAAKLLALSRGNVVHARAVAAASDDVFVVCYDPHDAYASLLSADLGAVVRSLRAPPWSAVTAAFDQVRVVVVPEDSGRRGGAKALHMTVRYRGAGDAERRVSLEYGEGLGEAVRAACEEGGVLRADLYTVWFKPADWSPTDPGMAGGWAKLWKKVVVALPPPGLELDGRAWLHITEEAGPFKTADMGRVAEWLRGGAAGRLELDAGGGKGKAVGYVAERQADCSVDAGEGVAGKGRGGSRTKVELPETVARVARRYRVVGVAGFGHGDW
jgi:hypothetical protein